MRTKVALPFALCVILTALPGCDNVYWGGVEVALQPPEPPLRAELPEAPEDGAEPQPVPVETGPVLYLVERSGTTAAILPVARITPAGLEPLPDPEDTPDLVERFPLERWEPGAEFVLLDRGTRAGTFLPDGSVSPDSEACLLRPRGGGRVELRPEAQGTTRFLALARSDLALLGLGELVGDPRATWPSYPGPQDLRTAALSAARFTLERASIPWPPSLPEILRDQRGILLPGGEAGLAATLTFGGELEVGRVPASGYGLFVIARPGTGTTWVPVWSWYQPVRSGKAFVRALAEGSSVSPAGGTHSQVLVEVLGEDRRWLAVVEGSAEGWRVAYQDPCGAAPGGSALRDWP
jgi:hypothetical protein